jgi:hypothetical protein
MRLIQKQQAIGAKQASMDWLHAVGNAVAAKQQAGSNLIHSGT